LSAIDRQVFAERVSAVERHLRRVSEKLAQSGGELQPLTDATDAIVLHLWQAVQLVLDLGISICIRQHLGTPASYRDAFERLCRAGHLESELAERLARAAGFRNAVAHAYESLDLVRVHAAATSGPADLRAFLVVVRDLIDK
jgi:uncharacterized protein YutE (UPF0331/DUF86 family)